MAEHANTPSVTGRRRFAGALLAIGAGSGITAGAAANVADLVPNDPDADLLALRPELIAAVADISRCEMDDGLSEDQMDEASDRLLAACWAIIRHPPAVTPAGLALKATGVMQQLRLGFTYGSFRNDGDAMAWHVMSQIAGDVYAPPALPERLRAACEPSRT